MPPKQAHDVVEGFLDIDAVLCRRLDEITPQLPRQGLPLLRAHLALRDAISLVAHEHDWDAACWCGGGDGGAGVRGRVCGGLLDPLDLVVEALDAGEAAAGGDGVDEDEAFAVADPLVAERGVFFLAGCVEDFEHAGLAVYHHLFAVGVLDCWVVSMVIG